MLDKSIDERYKSGIWVERKAKAEQLAEQRIARRGKSGGSFFKFLVAILLLATAAFALWYTFSDDDAKFRFDSFGTKMKSSVRHTGNIQIKVAE
jgi:hypothetical protein